MKKLLSVVVVFTAGLMSANQPLVDGFQSENILLVAVVSTKTCVPVESDCGNGGTWFACGYKNEDGDVDHEVKDEIRQLLNEAFCGY